MKLDEAIQNRRSIRKFNTKKPDWRDIIECIDVARYAPMAGNNYTLRFILIDDKEKIQKIAKAAQQDFVSQAKYVVVVCSNPSKTTNTYEKGEIFCRQQAGAAIQNFLLKIERAKIKENINENKMIVLYSARKKSPPIIEATPVPPLNL